jgi:hypothetical protein
MVQQGQVSQLARRPHTRQHLTTHRYTEKRAGSGLAGQRRQPLHPLHVGDFDLPAGALELVVHEARPFIDSIAARIGRP